MIGRIYIDGGHRPHRKDAGRNVQFARVLAHWQGRGPRRLLVAPADGGLPHVEPYRGLRRRS
jgi:hypothetical protein